MSQNIDNEVLSDESPRGLNPSNAVNGGLELHGKPGGIKKINKIGLILGAGLLAGAAIIAVTTFGGSTGAVKDAAKDAVANQKNQEIKPVAQDSNGTWYANKSDTLVATLSDPASANSTATGASFPGVPNLVAKSPTTNATTPPLSPNVPDLSGRPASLATSTTNPSVNVPLLNKTGGAGIAPQKSQAEMMADQKREQEKARVAQELDQAKKATLSAQGFGAELNKQPPAPMMPQYAGGTGTMQPVGFNPGAAQTRDEDPNKQASKEAFLEKQKNGLDPDYSTGIKRTPKSPFELKAGSIIPAVMIGGINSDLPGEVIAQVKENVFDSKTGALLLIPQGSRLVGLYDSNVTYGQSRVLLAWNRIIFPNGDSFNLKGMPGADAAGYAGFSDEVDNHYAKVFGNAILLSIISAGVQISQPNNGGGTSAPGSQGASVSQTVGASLGQQIGQTALTITQKNVNVQPTLKIRPGYQFNVMVTADMILPPTKN